MRTITFLAVALLALPFASADTLYKFDDGSSENSVGLTSGGELAWINQFTVQSGNNVINQIQVCFGSPSFPGSSGMTPGKNFDVYVWSDPNGDGNPLDAVLLGTTTGQAAAGSIDTDVFQNVAVNVVVPTNNFFIGVSANQNAGTYPAPLDQSSPPTGKSWVAGSGTQGGFDPNNLNGGIGLFNMNDIGLPGNWLVRANGTIPEPASLMLIGLAALALRRR